MDANVAMLMKLTSCPLIYDVMVYLFASFALFERANAKTDE